ncbi:hypothetical protein NIES970_27360 (plasmid) [[Synechococcus] sp. NIES-970]|nr:hypothetical protein NIES970_27360 [[Synechococcus] sp. NIES-970]
MKTDKWFYKLFLSQPGMLAELLPEVDADWEFTYSAPVLKEKEFRLDGVFIPVSDDITIPIVFAEAQMQADNNFYRRYFAEIFLYLKQYEVDRTWRGLLILPNPSCKLGSELPYQELFEQRVTKLYLSDLKQKQHLTPNLGLLQFLASDRDQSAELGRRLLNTAETAAEFERRLSLIETILAGKFPDLTKEMIMQILDVKQMDITQSRFYQEISEEGRQQGEARLVLRLLSKRFGTIDEAIANQISQLEISELESLGESLLDFQSLDDLIVWLAASGHTTYPKG